MSTNNTGMTVGDITSAHTGQRVVADLAAIQGWLPHLLLTSAEHHGGETRLMFRWDDDPSPSNTRRGQFACGVMVASDTPCRVTPPETATVDENSHSVGSGSTEGANGAQIGAEGFEGDA